MDIKNSHGGCICGTVRYQITKEPITFLACHCSDCQTITGSGFVLALRVPYDAVCLVEGVDKVYERTEAEARRRLIHRCPNCLTVLWVERPDTREYVTIYAGTLDDSPSLRPVAHIWIRDALPWITLPRDVLLYEENSPDMGPMIEAWRQRSLGG